MLGCIIGDIAGSTCEFDEFKSKEFPLFFEGSDYTDDTIMTLAVASALIKGREVPQRPLRELMVEEMRRLGRKYPYPMGAYGARFSGWLRRDDPAPYYSCGNGSAMRAAPCGFMAVTLPEAIALARVSAEVTHDHPEGIKGAEATAACVFLARSGYTREDIRDFVRENYYPLDKTLDEIRPGYGFRDTCQETVPQAIQAFLESESFEDAIRNGISLGGDADTLTCITGGIAEAYYVRGRGCDVPWMGPVRFAKRTDGTREDPRLALLPEGVLEQVRALLPEDLTNIADRFAEAAAGREGAYDRIGMVRPYILD
ncbi:MAG: ADP-ribosylglycohydrolase family protein [Oscillospiraceae bacterium]|nr:ADP-ribosylglycohydrolase family protein [Oscillospiraceae bacterium]